MASNDKAIPVRTIDIPWKALVVRADPEFEQKKRREPFYEFTGRTFEDNNATKGPYSTVPNQR